MSRRSAGPPRRGPRGRARALRGLPRLWRGPLGSHKGAVLGSLALIAALTGLGAWTHALGAGSTWLREWLRGPSFQLETVLILGLDGLEPSEVLGTPELRAGTPLVDVDLDFLVARIEANPRIRRCRGARLFPHWLLLAIDPRQPVARLEGRPQAIDREGVRFPLASRELTDLPRISGNAEEALAALSAARTAGLEIERVSVRAPEDVRVWPLHSAMRLRVGRDVARAFADWARLRQSGALESLTGTEIDLRFRGNAILAGNAQIRDGG